MPPAHDAAAPADGSAGAGDAQVLLARFLEPLMRIAGAQAAAVRVLSTTGDQLLMVGSCGLPERVARSERSVDSGCGVCGAALAGNKIAWADDPQHCARRNDYAYFGRDSHRVLAVPLTHGGRVLGVYTLFFAGLTAIDAEKRTRLENIGGLLGLALHEAPRERENLQAALVSQRHAIAAEVHDSVAQTLTFVKMRMPLLQEAVAAHDAANALRYCDDVRRAVTSAHTNLRKLLSEFRVPVDPQGLGSALRSAILVFTERAQVALDFDDQALGVRLSALQETQVFHIVQESLSNIAKHAAARQAWLRIEAAGGRVDVVVEDDGSGPSGHAEAANTGHFGVDIMRQRAACLGGSIDIGPRSGGGTRVHLSFPLIDAAAGVA